MDDRLPGLIGVPIERMVSLPDLLTDERAKNFCAELRRLDAESPTERIRLQIYSDGGSVSATTTVLGTMQSLRAPIHTFCLGYVRGTAILIAAAGTPGFRTATKITSFSFSDVVLREYYTREEAVGLSDLPPPLDKTFLQCTNLTPEKISELASSKKYFQAKRAIALGIIDSIENVICIR